jgi:acyl carrier protein
VATTTRSPGAFRYRPDGPRRGLRDHPRPPGRHPGDRGVVDLEGQSFTDDLEADSLALIELVEAIEEAMSDQVEGFRIEDDDLEDLKTVRDAVDYVCARLS